MKREIDFGHYTQSMFDCGYYVGAMKVALPIQELMKKSEENNFEDPIETLIAIATVIKIMATPLNSDEIQGEMAQYNDIIKDQKVFVEIEEDN